MNVRWGLRRVGVGCALGLLLVAGGCKRHRKTRSAPKSEDYAEKLKPIIDSKKIQVLHFPDFSDYAPLVQTFYDDRNYEVAWVDNVQPDAQAAAFIALFKDAAKKGLNPQDFDADKWDGRIAGMKGNDDAIAQFDAAMTVCVMRYISDLRIGRVNPTHFNFDINTQDKKYDLPEFVSDNAVDATDVPALIRTVEPDNEQYRKTEDALAKYIELAKQPQGDPLPTVAKPVSVGGSYAALAQLATRLALEGDYSSHSTYQEPPPPVSPVYSQDLSDGVRHYQARHGITEDGKLNAQTIASLNVPLAARVNQLSDSLERWRWLPDEYVNSPLQVNLPEFVLRGYDSGQPGHSLDFTMKVVDGKALGEHDTPVFTHEMKYVIFRPYWNVPMSIIKKELTPHIEHSGVGYLASKNFETVDSKGSPVEATAAMVEHGGVVVREKPGPKNSLGLVKFMFPNEYDIYLHSTPAPELFNRTRRDFSHGCVRVQKPDELAVWVLRNTPGDWNIDKVHEAFATGPDNHQVNLTRAIPITIFYATANVADDGAVHFFDDIYGYDKRLNDVLAKGMPYPANQVKVNPNAVATPGDTN